MIAFLEADDFFTPDSLEERVKVFQKNPETTLVFGDVKMFGDPLLIFKKKLIFYKNLARIKPDTCFKAENCFFKFNFIKTASSVLVKKNDIEKISFSKKFDVWQDWWTWAQLGKGGVFYYLPRICVHWNIHQRSYSQIHFKNVNLSKFKNEFKRELFKVY